MNAITVRKVQFQFPDDIDPVFVKNDPTLSGYLGGLSMMLPYLEPYLIRVMRKAKAEVENPELMEDMRRFSAQEGNHYQQHAKLNQVLREVSENPEQLMACEEIIKNEYQHMLKHKSLRFNLAYSEGFEAFASALAVALLNSGIIKHEMSGPVAELLDWHLLEELEHRTVAFDVYNDVAGDYFYKVVVALYAQWHLIYSCIKLGGLLLPNDSRIKAFYNKPGMRRAGLSRKARLLSRLIPLVLKTYMPWYNPRQIKLPAYFLHAAQMYTDRASVKR